MFKKILFILILPFFLYAQWTDPRPKSIQLWHLNTSFFDSLGNVVRDSVATLSSDGVTITNDGALKQKVFTTVAALEAVSASDVGMTVILTDPYYTEMVYSDSTLPEEGGIARNAGTQGKQWISKRFLQTNEINTREFGLLSSNTASQNNTALQNVFDFINALSNDSVTVFIPDGRYEFSTKFIINNSVVDNGERAIILKGGSNTRLVQTADDTLFATKNFFTDLKLENLCFVGNGKENGSVAISIPQLSGGFAMQRVSIDSFALGLWVDDLTRCVIEDTRFRKNRVGAKLNFNIDGYDINGSSEKNDTSFVITGASNDNVKFRSWLAVQDSVWMVFKGGGGFEVHGGYFEDVRHLGYIGTDDAYELNGLRSITFQNWVSQGTHESGFVFYDNDAILISGCRVTGTSATPFFDIRSFLARVTTESNYFSGSNMLFQYKNTPALQYSHLEALTFGERNVQRYNAQGLSVSSPMESIEAHSVTDTVYLMKKGNVGGSSRSFSNYLYLMLNPTYLSFGTEGMSYWDFSGSNVQPPPSGTDIVDYRGHLLYQTTSRDVPWMNIQFQTGDYKWIDILTGKPKGEGFMAGQDAFAFTAIHDTVLITGVHPDSDYVHITPITSNPSDTSSVLSYTLSSDTLFVHRQTGAISGLNYVWRRMKNRIK